MRRREFIAISFSSVLYNYFFLKRKIYANNLNIESIFNLPNKEPSDFYSAELIKDTFYLPVKSKSCILTFNRKTSNESKIALPINTEPDIVFFSKKYGLFIGLGSSYPPIFINDLSSNKISVIDEEFKKYFYEKPYSERFSATSIKDSPSGEKIFIGNSRGNPIIYEKNKLSTINNPYFKEYGTYDAVWISETEILISSMAGKVLFVEFRDNETKILKQFKIKGSYRFSPILDQKIILTTVANGGIYIFSVNKEKNLNQNHNPKISKIIRVPFRYHLFQRFIPSAILENYNWGKYNSYFNDVHWITKNKFALTTRTGNSLLIMDLEGNILNIIRNKNLVPTRFIGSRFPSKNLIFVSKSGFSQINELII